MFDGCEIAVWALLVGASFTDLRWGKIPNALTFPFLAVGLGYRFTLGGRQGFESLIAVFIAFALFFPLYRLRAFAAADVKLLMAVGAWTDPRTVLGIGVMAILIGAGVGAFILWRQIGIRESFSTVIAHMGRGQIRRSHKMPFAPAFLCGFVFLKIAESYRWSII